MTTFEHASDYIYLRTYLIEGKPAEYSVYDIEKKEYQSVTDIDEYFSQYEPITKSGSIIEFASRVIDE